MSVDPLDVAPVAEPDVDPVTGFDKGGTPDAPRLRDYRQWHHAYDDPASSLSARLRVVQAELAAYLDRTPGPLRVLSACSGDGRDILQVLAARTDADRVTGVLVEIDDELAARARESIAALGAEERIAVVQGDAGVTDPYAPYVPADLIILSGIMGNITHSDLRRLIRTARTFAAPGASVLWTRGTFGEDIAPLIRGWFAEEGFEEVALHENIEGKGARVGVVRLVAEPLPFEPGQPIFTFYK